MMALLRAVGVPCRLHACLVRKKLQWGAIMGLVYRLLPEKIHHTWVEAHHENSWHTLEGVILDTDFVKGVRAMFPHSSGAFCGYAIATDSLPNLTTEWDGGNTYVQHRAMVRDLGVFDSPDDESAHGTSCPYGDADGAPRRQPYKRQCRHRTFLACMHVL